MCQARVPERQYRQNVSLTGHACSQPEPVSRVWSVSIVLASMGDTLLRNGAGRYSDRVALPEITLNDRLRIAAFTFDEI